MPAMVVITPSGWISLAVLLAAIVVLLPLVILRTVPGT
jgi:hypothetical protein